LHLGKGIRSISGREEGRGEGSGERVEAKGEHLATPLRRETAAPARLSSLFPTYVDASRLTTSHLIHIAYVSNWISRRKMINWSLRKHFFKHVERSISTSYVLL